MEKRKLMIDGYDTALEGLWTLSALSLSEPEIKTEYVSVPGRSGDLDLSDVLTDGEPTYQNRTLEATLESSEGSRLERNERISYMINLLDGFNHKIILPDDTTHYLFGRLRIKTDYSDNAHASVSITVNCEPWLYSVAETRVLIESSSGSFTYGTLRNRGRKSVIPEIQIITNSEMTIKFGDNTWALSAGTYTFPEIYLKTGSYPVTLSGEGKAIFTYREAVLK